LFPPVNVQREVLDANFLNSLREPHHTGDRRAQARRKEDLPDGGVVELRQCGPTCLVELTQNPLVVVDRTDVELPVRDPRPAGTVASRAVIHSTHSPLKSLPGDSELSRHSGRDLDLILVPGGIVGTIQESRSGPDLRKLFYKVRIARGGLHQILPEGDDLVG